MFETRQDWAPTPDWVWHVSADDIGRHVVVKVAARRKKTYYPFQDADDYTYAVYDVLPPPSYNPANDSLHFKPASPTHRPRVPGGEAETRMKKNFRNLRERSCAQECLSELSRSSNE